MRIVGGSLRGRRFRGPPKDSTRPTTDRVREALASALVSRGALEGARVLDLFSGTGALAFEALSRGAESAVLVESDARVFRSLSQSAKELGLSDQARARRADIFRSPAKAVAGGPFSLVFIDPPYARVPELGGVLSALASQCAPGALIVVEQDRRTPFDFETHSLLSVVGRYEYGDTLITFAEFS